MKKFLFLFLTTGLIISCSEYSSDDRLDNSHPNGGGFSANESGAGGNWSGNTGGGTDGETYGEFEENDFIKTSDESTSTFSIDADGGSYSNIRDLISEGSEIPKYAIRTEEIINYFQYDYDDNSGNHPITLNGEISTCPWEPGHKLLRVGIKGKEIPFEALPPSNIVLLIDVSGSMSYSNKLDLLKESFNLLVDKLRPQDRIAIVTYAGSSGVVLESTPCSEKDIIKSAINSLGSGGGTNGAEGIITAYSIAEDHFQENGNNRVILASDGDFNVGITSREDLEKLIEEEREKGIFLTTIGVGRGNYNDANMEQIANHGNGTYEYIDNLDQAKKVFIDEFSKLYTVAKDVKVQLTFNQRLVDSYRLIGYENRVLENEDFEDDTKDAGEIGAGQTITAYYQIIPSSISNPPVFEETFSIDFRYKLPNEDASQLITLNIIDQLQSFNASSEDHRFVGAMAALGMHLFNSKYKGDIDLNKIKQWVDNADSFDPNGYKSDLKDLLDDIN